MGVYKRGRPSGQLPPPVPGEYRLVNRNTGKADYTGETNDLRRRKHEHFSSRTDVSPETHNFMWKQADARSGSKTRRKHESDKIDQHQPRLNIRRGGGGRNAGR
jgi:excinuclease UvrABC nuclease subunit